MNAHPSAHCPVLRYRPAPRKTARVANDAAVNLRLEGSLAAIIPLAPVIPIFPWLHLALNHSAAKL